VWGVDISEHQLGLAVSSLKPQGYRFAFLRCTGGLNNNGTIYKDSTYAAFSDACRRQGILQGAYHFLIEKPAAQQVGAFLAVAGDLKDKMVMLDFELYGPAKAYSPSNKTLRDVIAELRRRGVSKPIIVYSGKSYWEDYGEPSGKLSDYGDDLIAWDALYPLGTRSGCSDDLYDEAYPHGWGQRWGGVEPWFWQFTGYGRIDGYSRDVDLNAYRGTYEQLVNYTQPKEGGTQPVPPAKPQPQRDWPIGVPGPPKEPQPPPRQGNYQQRHPTRYDWREDVESVVYRLFRNFRNISINTYVDHPATEFAGPIYGGRTRTSFDVWGIKGRNDPLNPLLGTAIMTYLFRDPKPPMIDWIIWQQRMWTRSTGRWVPYGSDPFTWHNDHIHVTYMGPQRR
jgi:lysozyme